MAESKGPLWLQTLQLLEAAAAVKPAKPAPVPAPAPAALAAEGYFPAVAPLPDDSEGFDAEGMARLESYLASFTESGQVNKNVEEEPWARALRILEAVPLPRREKIDEHKDEDLRMDRYNKLLRGESEDPQQAVRLRSYDNLIAEAERAGKAAPGASLPPLRFDPYPSKPRREAPDLPAPAPPSASARKRADLDDPLKQAVGRGNLVSAPLCDGDPDAERDDAPLRKEDFVWSEHDFNDGDEENKRVLRRFTKEFKEMAAATPDGLRSSKLLTAALDLALACVKCYELDKADAIFRRCIGECRRRGMPWDVKCLQDMATLRCKQHRQADAAELLEELANKAPPHPATFINLGTVYNQLRQYDKAEAWFLQAVNLKGGKPGREDFWNLGIVAKNKGNYDEALPMLRQALAEFQEHEPDHPVTLAKLHSSVGGCLHDMGRTADAVDEYQQAYDLYVQAVGRHSPLFCGAAEGLAKALQAEGRYAEAFEALIEAFTVHANCDSVHPTPLFEGLEMALRIHEKHPEADLALLAPRIDEAIQNLASRGLASDGNAGLVMCRGGKVLLRTGSRSLRGRAAELLSRGRSLIQKSQDDGEAELSHELLEAELLLHSATEAGTLAR